MERNKRGVSLIVLVITIVVMIILAASIILSLSGSGIIGKANKAKVSTNLATAKEIKVMAEAEWELKNDIEKEEYDNKLSNYVEEKLEEAGVEGESGRYVLSDSGALNEEYKDNTQKSSDENAEIGKKVESVIIPEGFVASIYAGETNIEDGLVIYETTTLSGVSHKEAMETYNQFVWVPVAATTTYTRATNTGALEAQYNAICDSIEKYDGYYIARYEAGMPKEVKISNKELTGDLTKAPLSIKGIDTYGHVTYTYTDNTSAYNIANNMYASSKSVTSTVCYENEWKAALYFTLGIQSGTYDSAAVGNHKNSTDAAATDSGKLQTTGKNEAWKLKNIYDLAGNVYENTPILKNGRIAYNYISGGSYDLSTEAHPVTRTGSTSSIHRRNSFRVAMYIK